MDRVKNKAATAELQHTPFEGLTDKLKNEISRAIVTLLRHGRTKAGASTISFADDGTVSTPALVEQLNEAFKSKRVLLKDTDVFAAEDGQADAELRFETVDDGRRIRAINGHAATLCHPHGPIRMELVAPPVTPGNIQDKVIFHDTNETAWASIVADGYVLATVKKGSEEGAVAGRALQCHSATSKKHGRAVSTIRIELNLDALIKAGTLVTRTSNGIYTIEGEVPLTRFGVRAYNINRRVSPSQDDSERGDPISILCSWDQPLL